MDTNQAIAELLALDLSFDLERYRDSLIEVMARVYEAHFGSREGFAELELPLCRYLAGCEAAAELDAWLPPPVRETARSLLANARLSASSCRATSAPRA